MPQDVREISTSNLNRKQNMGSDLKNTLSTGLVIRCLNGRWMPSSAHRKSAMWISRSFAEDMQRPWSVMILCCQRGGPCPIALWVLLFFFPFCFWRTGADPREATVWCSHAPCAQLPHGARIQTLWNSFHTAVLDVESGKLIMNCNKANMSYSVNKTQLEECGRSCDN